MATFELEGSFERKAFSTRSTLRPSHLLVTGAREVRSLSLSLRLLRTMNGLATPKLDMTSAAFMTPPSSLTKDNQPPEQPRGLPLLRFPLPSTPLLSFSLLTPKREPETRVDFVSSLYPNFIHITYQILSHLSPPDLLSCLRVSKKWREAVLSRPPYIKSIAAYKAAVKSNQENLVVKPSSLSTDCFDEEAVKKPEPLTQRRLNQPSLLPPLSSSSATYRVCPRCSSPATKPPSSKVARCSACDFSFCCECLKQAHEHTPCHSNSPKKRAMSLLVGGRTNKKRLKRL